MVSLPALSVEFHKESTKCLDRLYLFTTYPRWTSTRPGRNTIGYTGHQLPTYKRTLSSDPVIACISRKEHPILTRKSSVSPDLLPLSLTLNSSSPASQSYHAPLHHILCPQLSWLEFNCRHTVVTASTSSGRGTSTGT